MQSWDTGTYFLKGMFIKKRRRKKITNYFFKSFYSQIASLCMFKVILNYIVSFISLDKSPLAFLESCSLVTQSRVRHVHVITIRGLATATFYG